MSSLKAAPTRVLLSIKPQYAQLIFAGQKRYEYRRSVFKHRSIRTVVVYESSPTRQVVGEFDILAIHDEEVHRLWAMTREYAGIAKIDFFVYFKDRTRGYAIEIGQVRRYRRPCDLDKAFGLTPPQSFAYLY